MNYPILYSFRRCPYAMRARMALLSSGVTVELREVLLRDKPPEMLLASPKATVPVLILNDKTVIDESIDIMRWALKQNDPENWLMAGSPEKHVLINTLIDENDLVFKQHLDQYKYADRYPAYPAEYYREQGEQFLRKIDSMLQQSDYLLAARPSLADIALFPFIRQFAYVDKNWFDASNYKCLQKWLESLLVSPLFVSAMRKIDVWQAGDESVLFN